MSTRTVVDYSTLAPKFAAACAAAVSFAVVGMLYSAPYAPLQPAPRSEFIVTLPTIVVVPDAADRAAAAALDSVVAATAGSDLDGV